MSGAADKRASLSDTNGSARSFAYDLAGRITNDVWSCNENLVD